MQNFDVVGALAFFTISAVLVFGIVSWMRAKKAKDHHEDAAVARRQRHEDEMPVGETGTGTPVAGADPSRTWSKERGANPPTPITPPD